MKKITTNGKITRREKEDYMLFGVIGSLERVIGPPQMKGGFIYLSNNIAYIIKRELKNAHKRNVSDRNK